MVTGPINNVSAGPAIAHRILLVEDDEQTAESLKILLGNQGYDVIVAKDGGQAQSSFVMRKPDFVILDLMLPSESGFEVCERMKQSDESIPVLIVSVIDMQDSRNLAERIGADGYLTKPVEPAMLLESITEISQRVWNRAHGVETQEKNRIRFNCSCGKRFKVSPVHRGRTMTCPDCGTPLVVPWHE